MNSLETLVREYAYVNNTPLELLLSATVRFVAAIVFITVFKNKDCCLALSEYLLILLFQ